MQRAGILNLRQIKKAGKLRSDVINTLLMYDVFKYES